MPLSSCPKFRCIYPKHHHLWLQRHVFATVFKAFYVSTHLRQDNTQRLNNFTFFVADKILKTIIIMLQFVRDYYLIYVYSIGCLDLWNSFLLTLTFSNFSVFSLILIILKKLIYFVTLLFLLNQLLISFPLILFNLVFFFFWQVFVSVFWLFFYCFFVF